MATNLQCRNTSVRNSLRVTYEDRVEVSRTKRAVKGSDGKTVKEPDGSDKIEEIVKYEWKMRDIVGIIKPNEPFDLWCAYNTTRIANIEELPT